MEIAIAGGPAIPRRPTLARKAFAGERLMHQPKHRIAKSHEADQPSPREHARGESFGPIDRLEDPHIFGLGPLGAVFFAENTVIGKMPADDSAHGLFGSPVGRRNRVETADLLVFDCKGCAEKREDCVAGSGGELVDEAAEIDGRHVFLRPIGELACRQPSVATHPKAQMICPHPVALRSSTSLFLHSVDRWSPKLDTSHAKSAWGKPL